LGVNLSGISPQSLLGRILRSPLRLVPRGAVVPIVRGRLRGNKWVAGSSNHGCWLGTYETRKRLLVEQTIREGAIVFDIGAHVGFYTLLASVLVGPRGRVFAFEPLGTNLQYLQEHIRLNRVTNVTVIEAAVSNTAGVALFEEGQDRSMGRISTSGLLEVPVVVLDELVARGTIPMPQYVKMDIEGNEVAALCGAKSILQTAHPTLFLATHGSDAHRECCELLRSLGYHIQAVDGVDLEHCSEVLAWWSRGSDGMALQRDRTRRVTDA
jgi:FkbM family methyltransferase